MYIYIYIFMHKILRYRQIDGQVNIYADLPINAAVRLSIYIYGEKNTHNLLKRKKKKKRRI